jgi:hypothetical protein
MAAGHLPAMFLGTVGRVALSHLPGPSLVDRVAMGIGGMTAVMLRLPLTSTLLAALSSTQWQVDPLVAINGRRRCNQSSDSPRSLSGSAMRSISTIRPLATVKAARKDRAG